MVVYYALVRFRNGLRKVFLVRARVATGLRICERVLVFFCGVLGLLVFGSFASVEYASLVEGALCFQVVKVRFGYRFF